MNYFSLSRYGPSKSATDNRKLSRSDLAFQKLKKYEEKYKTGNVESVPISSGSGESDSESGIENHKSVLPKYTGPRGTHQDSTTKLDASKHSVQKVEDVDLSDKHSRLPENKSLIIDLNLNNVHLVDSDDSKMDIITNSSLNVGQDRNFISHKKPFDASKLTSEQNLIHQTIPSTLKTTVNNNLIESGTFDDLNKIHNLPHNYHTDPDDDHIYSTSISADNKISLCTKNRNESKKVDLDITDKMKEAEGHYEPVKYCPNQNKNDFLKQNNCDFLSDSAKLHVEPESIRTEIIVSNSDVTSYEVPDISNSFGMDIREKPKSSHLDVDVTSESSVTLDKVPQNADVKPATVPASNNITDDNLNSEISLCTKCKKSFLKQYKPQTDETYCYCNTKSTQTNINVNFLHHMTDIKFPNTTVDEDIVMSPYSLFIYNYLLHGYSKEPIKKDTVPAVSFLNKNLMEEVNITQYLIKTHHATYNAYCTAARNLSKNYQPVTLENTMKYIKQSKKKRRNKMVSP